MSTHAAPDVGRRALPAVLRASRGLLVFLAVVHLLVPVGMWAGRGDLAAQIAAAHPEFDAATVQASVRVALGAGVVFHLVVPLVTVAGLLLLALVTIPEASRRHFTAGRES